jgi:FkbM family methyltransferase
MANPQNIQFVKSVYNILLDRDPEPAGLSHWSESLANGLSQKEFIRAVISSAEFRSKMSSLPEDNLDDVDLIVRIGSQQLRLPANDLSLVPHLLKHRSWEPHVTNYLMKVLKPTNTFIDIGANLGYFTVLCAPFVNQVIAFEPVNISHKYCLMNIELNGLKNVTLYKYGLWEKEIDAEISVDPSMLMASCIGQGEEIKCIALDSLSLKPSVIKMDIEGSEFFALCGMEKTLEQSRPVLVMELNRPALEKYGKDSEDIWNFFKDINYKVAVLRWGEEEPESIKSLKELNKICPPNKLIDIVAQP